MRATSTVSEVSRHDFMSSIIDDDDDEWNNTPRDGNDDDGDDGEDDEELSMPLSEASSLDTIGSRPESKVAQALAKQRREQKRVFSAKLFVMTIFLLVSLGISMTIYGFANRQQINSLKSKLSNQAERLFDVSKSRMEDFFIRFGNLGLSFAAQVEASDDVWPFVLIPNYEVQVDLFFQQQPTALSSGPVLLSVLIPQRQKEDWEQFALGSSPLWIEASYDALNLKDKGTIPSISPVIFVTNNEMMGSGNGNSSVYAPFWMSSLTGGNGSVDVINYNSLDDDLYAEIERGFGKTYQDNRTELPLLVLTPSISQPSVMFPRNDSSPQSIVATALFDTFDEDSRQRVSTLSIRIAWHAFFQDILQDKELDGGPMLLAMQDTCGRSFMFKVTGSSIEFTGSKLEPTLAASSTVPVYQRAYNFVPLTSTNCSLVIHLAASDELYESLGSSLPIMFGVSVLGTFAAMAIIFWCYDRLAGRSYFRAVDMAQQSVRQLKFLPKLVRDRVSGSDRSHATNIRRSVNALHSTITMMEDEDSPPDDAPRHSRLRGEKAVADLHPNVTVMYADIANFTAWSSVREPSQVFQLLETLYDAFDKLCGRYKIFKVETVGDSYVAVSGIPTAVEEHAVNMARFAREMMNQMSIIVNQLEVSLGPETAELTLRIGMNSGPVTAGVLRGEKSRFQLFGETVNTASRMEGTGIGGRIQVSGITAELLKKCGKEDWLTPRDDLVEVKGRGEVQTYWLSRSGGMMVHRVPTSDEYQQLATFAARTPGRLSVKESDRPQDPSGTSSRSRESDGLSATGSSDSATGVKTERMVDWCADLLLGLLKKIVAMRESEDSYNELREFQEIVRELDSSARHSSDDPNHVKRLSGSDGDAKSNVSGKGAFMFTHRTSIKTPQHTKMAPLGRGEPFFTPSPNKTVLDEVAEIISLPRKTARYQQDPNKIELSSNVVRQLYRFVREVAAMYRDNPFHNFQHASHVTMSLTKLLSRVVAPDEVDYETMTYKKKVATAKLHKFTFGITSDPLTQFACAFSSLIHDMDHPGVPNVVLVSEGTDIAKHYANKSVAEQNSVDLAWGLLMEPQYKDLRQCIYRTQSELVRFRQLVVNSVMATDIVDKELGQRRKNRWDRAFNKAVDDMDEKATDDVNRKATIVIEHLIQAADVAHTMQHWHVYLKWNERFFRECYGVYLSGRSQADPSDNWYKGEIGFFDFYIIPLAKKLESCGVFGVSSDECLSYAQANRDEWERKGEEIVKGYLAKYGRQNKGE